MNINEGIIDIVSCPIYIRPITYDDTENIVKWRNSDDVRKNFIYQGLFTNESHEKWMRDMVETGKVCQMIICISDTNQPVGSVYIRDIDEATKSGEYGIFIGEADARGCGYGNMAAKLMVNFARNVLKLETIFLRAFADNAPAIKSYENAGFVINGQSEDVTINDITRKVVFMELKL